VNDMANQHHLERLRQGGANAWNMWRQSDPAILPELHGADLNEANLTDAFVRAADFSWTNVSQAIITAGQLQSARLSPDDL